ncbi:MAG: DUF853 domain-containing protein, partial [Actinomycetota bacterium]|nr:DUF853 domain-containing protein [Actinomycetota bacterium]
MTFADDIAGAYATEGASLDLGRGVHEGAVAPEAVVRVPLAMLNRHGLVAGATGTGKTKTLQLMAEQLSEAGVPVFVADVKGDVSGLAAPGDPAGPAGRRNADLGLAYAPQSFPVEFLSLGGIGPGVPVRGTVSDFGPQLLAKVLGANETQEQSLALLFRLADERALPLVDLADLRALLTHLGSKEGKAELEGLGGVSKATVGVLLRSLVALEDGGGNEFFGEPQLQVADLLRTAADGRGVISCLELAAVQDKPALWSTALMWLVAELFEELPEVGDLDKPKLVFFLDEAHLLFDDATDAFLDAVARTVRLIRSKGVGVFFVTQNPRDLPAEVLGQLGNRVQHALRAFTPDDAKALKATVSTFPRSEHYDLDTLLTSMGIGEAAVTILDEDGVPTPVVHTRLVGPRSRMAPADDVAASAQASPLWAKYATRADPASAKELLAARLEAATVEAAPQPEPEPDRVPVPK